MMASLPSVTLHPPESSSRIVSVIGPHPVRVECLCSVVGVEYHQGVLVNAQLLEQIEQSTGERIELVDEIPSRAGLGAAAELLGGQDRRMGDLCREDC